MDERFPLLTSLPSGPSQRRRGALLLGALASAALVFASRPEAIKATHDGRTAAALEAAHDALFSPGDDGPPMVTSRTVYVDYAAGDDTLNDGGTRAAPLRTLHAARDAARDLREGDVRVTVELAAGVHRLPYGEPLELGLEDSNTLWRGAGFSESDDDSADAGSAGAGLGFNASSPRLASWISGGFHVPPACWARAEGFAASNGTNGTWVCNLRAAGLPLALATRHFRSLRVGGHLASEARWPDAEPGRPWSSGWLFVEAATYFDTHPPSWVVMLDRARTARHGALPAWLTDATGATNWTLAKVKVVPKFGWNDYEATVAPASGMALTVAKAAVNSPGLSEARDDAIYLTITCPDSADSKCDGYDTKLDAGARLYVYGVREALSAGEWFHDGVGKLYAAPRAADAAGARALLASVVVPTMTSLVRVAGALGARGAPATDDDFASAIAFEGLGFVDADYAHDGFQNGFSMLASSAGVPSDAALEISGARAVHVRNCSFELLSGGGVHVTNGSRACTVEDSSFTRLGQSAVLLTGNVTTQPRGCTVARNTITTVGTILASAAGVFCSACSETVIHANDIVGSPRWGIALRAQASGGPADSLANTVARNRLRDLGEGTRDFGAISAIAYAGAPYAGTVISHNCVRHARGLFSESDGSLTDGTESYSVYLDNEASGYSVYGNVLNGAAQAAVFVHLGRGNTIEGNVLANATNADGDGSQGLQVEGRVGETANNTFRRNIVAVALTPTRSLVASTGTFDARYLRPDAVTENLYFPVARDFGDDVAAADGSHAPPAWWVAERGFTPLGNFSAWRAAGYDAGSIVADPLFIDARASNFCLDSASPAYALGFEAIPDEICNC